jgi:hypothetical protein
MDLARYGPRASRPSLSKVSANIGQVHGQHIPGAAAVGGISSSSTTYIRRASTEPKSRWQVISKSYETCGRESLVSHPSHPYPRMIYHSAEFQLVAGGEELLQEPHSLTPIKLECDSKPLNLDDSDPLSPMSTSAHSTCSSGLAGDTTHESSTLPSTDFSGPHLRPDSCSLIGHGEDLHAPGVELRYPFGRRTLTGRTHSGTSLGDTSRSPLSPLTSLPSSPVEQGSDVARIFEANSPPLTSNSQRDKKIWTENKICSLALWTEGMLPFTVSSGAVSSNNFSAREPIVFRVRLTLPSIGDLQCPPTLHGFQGTVSLSFPWQFSAQCITKAYTDRVCISEEVGYLQLISSHATNSYGPRMVQALLPESLLSRSRWLDATLQTCITQQIVADGFPLASIIYDLDRNDTGTASAQLQATQRRLQGESTRLSLPDHVPSTHLPSDDFLNIPTPFIPRLNRRPDSLSCETNHVPSFFPSPLF